jgi:hypothetical protein
MFLLLFLESKYFKTDARRSSLRYNSSMRIYWIFAILFIMVSCGEKTAEQSSALSPTQVGKPPVSTNPDSSTGDEPVSIFETEEFKNSLKQIKIKERALFDRGYKLKQNADGSYSWKEYFYKNELDGTLKWQEGVFATKFRTKIGGPTHDLISGEELPLYSEEMSLYHTEPVFEFLSLENWPKLEKYLGEAQDSIADHYNKYMNDLDDSTKQDLEARYNRIVSGYNNAKGHVNYLKLPILTWSEIITKYGKKDLIWVHKKHSLFDLANWFINDDPRLGPIAENREALYLDTTPDDKYPSEKKFRVYSALFHFIQEI